MAWRVAHSLEQLRSQINAAAPKRDRSSDGTIGDSAHASTGSDHNPWVKDGTMGVVTAMDITHDPAGGVDSYALAEALRHARDPRIKYVISNGRIFSASTSPWTWRKYTGSNAHVHHVHISVVSNRAKYDSVAPWTINLKGSAPIVPPTKPKRPVLRFGARGPDVEYVQKFLGLQEDGKFGANTLMAVHEFQKENGLVVDGIVGPYTWDLIEN